MVMAIERTQAAEVRSKHGIRTHGPQNVFSCPRGKNCTEQDGLIYFEKGSGWTNHYEHLLRCAFSNNKEQMHEDHMKLISKNGSVLEVQG